MKPPAFQFYVKDWAADTLGLSVAAKGAWIQALIVLHLAPKRGRLTQPLEAWARVFGTSALAADNLLTELKRSGCAKLTRRSDGRITLVSRRMDRERKAKEQAAQRQAKHRASRRRHGKVTSPSASASASAQQREREMPSTQQHGFRPVDLDVLKRVWSEVTGGQTDARDAEELIRGYSLGAVTGAIAPAYERWRKQGKDRPFTWGWVKVQLEQPAIVAKFQAQPQAVRNHFWEGTLEQRAHAWWKQFGQGRKP